MLFTYLAHIHSTYVNSFFVKSSLYLYIVFVGRLHHDLISVAFVI